MKYRYFVLILCILFLFSPQVNLSNANVQQISEESTFEYYIENMHFSEQYNGTYRSCPDIFIPLSEIESEFVNMTVKQDVQSEIETLPSYLDSHPENHNVTLTLNGPSIVTSGFIYTDQWVGFLDSMNKSVGKNLLTSLSKEDFQKKSCILPIISSYIFPTLQTMSILPIIASGDFNYYNTLLDKYQFENSPEFIDESEIMNISNQDILGMSFHSNFFEQIVSGAETINYWYNSNLNVDINLNTKAIIHFDFYISELYRWEDISRRIFISVEFTDIAFQHYYGYYLFGFKSNLATLFLIAVLTIFLRRKQKNK